MNITIQIPTKWLRELHAQFDLLRDSENAVRRMVVELLQVCSERYAGDKLQACSDEGLEDGSMRVMAYLPVGTARAVAVASKNSAMSPGAAAKAMLFALWKSKPESPSGSKKGDHPFGDLMLKIGKDVRMEQVTAFNCITDSLATERIGMIEASTGVGKTMASLVAASDWVTKSNLRLAITVPTLALIRQYIRDYATLSQARETPTLRVFFGRAEFVSRDALADFFTGNDDTVTTYASAKAWLDSGGLGSFETEGVSGYEESLWLVDNLTKVEPEFPIHEVLINESTSKEDEGFISYRKQFELSKRTNELVLCTHTMMACDFRQRMRQATGDEAYVAIGKEINGVFNELKALKLRDGEDQEKAAIMKELLTLQNQQAVQLSDSDICIGLLPRFSAVIVDEAHQLESNFANAFSDYLPIRKLVRALHEYKAQGGALSSQQLTKADSLVHRLSSESKSSDMQSLLDKSMAAPRAIICELLELIEPIAKAKITKRTNAQRIKLQTEISRAIGLMRLAVAGKTNVNAQLRLSPKRAYPQLYVGRDSVESILRMFWRGLTAGVAISATLYLRKSDGASASYMGTLLQIPETRRAEYPPIVANWLRECISDIHVPSGEAAIALTPPTFRNASTEGERLEKMGCWLDNLAKEIQAIHSASAGGVLVLNTSYEMVYGLSARLSNLEENLVSAKEGLSVRRQSKMFLTRSSEGKRPLWLALGGAWTGLDLGGHDPYEELLGLQKLNAQEDNVVTDLVIPRLPFGTNNSITHIHRIRMQCSVPWDMLDAAFRFSQGLGRLVRRRGMTKNRRIWVLDGRLDGVAAKTRMSLFWAAIAGWKPVPVC